MKAVLLVRILVLVVLAVTSAACELVGDIFQAGMAAGIIVVVLLVGLVFYAVSRLRA